SRQPDAVAGDGDLDAGPRRRRGLSRPAGAPAARDRRPGREARRRDGQDAAARADARPRTALGAPRAQEQPRRGDAVDRRGAEPADRGPAPRLTRADYAARKPPRTERREPAS